MQQQLRRLFVLRAEVAVSSRRLRCIFSGTEYCRWRERRGALYVAAVILLAAKSVRGACVFRPVTSRPTLHVEIFTLTRSIVAKYCSLSATYNGDISN